MQTTSHILMIRPVRFAFNSETAVNNAFQKEGQDNAQAGALAEFDAFVKKLQDEGVDVTVINDSPEPFTPDSIFPNNWVSFHETGEIILYPMFAPNRRLERKTTTLEALAKKFRAMRKIDLSYYENEGLFLEGTGSLVLDREHRIAYACLSPRTSKRLLQLFCDQLEYEPVAFHATDQSGEPIYHTNVMMCVANDYAVVCLESIKKKAEKQELVAALRKTNKEIIEISLAQMNQFAGNMLQVMTTSGENILVMSSQAFHSLTAKQVDKLESFNRIVHAPLDTIETNGGGSARCMMAEIFLPEINS